MFSRLIWTRHRPNIQIATKEPAFSTNSASAFATFRVCKPPVGYFTCRWVVAIRRCQPKCSAALRFRKDRTLPTTAWSRRSTSAPDYRRGEERSPDGPDAATRAGNLRAPFTEPLVLRTESGRPHEGEARQSLLDR